MSKLIIVCGLPGSGKTTLAEELSRELRIACLHKDSIKEKLCDLLELKTLDDSRDIGLKTVKLLYRLVEEQLKRGVDIIVESPFAHVEDYKLINEWIRKYKVDLFSVICFIETDTRKRRFETRSRHSCHCDHERDPKWGDPEYNFNSIPGRQIRVRTDRSVKKIVNSIKKEVLC